ncbi:hypothetical protein CH380_07090 [Leptospira adleri]|uniref:Uncharacterized protein n=1 Tax=Leptospira adleri TaxID=2023186 RepID=A0A2M9YQG3_9LEPT|nr:hypothetical protein CH380_07090 [Leptospira adleri]PJZ61067.1 hypothetical protein CH376_15310 [Leptospira adleri]
MQKRFRVIGEFGFYFRYVVCLYKSLRIRRKNFLNSAGLYFSEKRFLGKESKSHQSPNPQFGKTIWDQPEPNRNFIGVPTFGTFYLQNIDFLIEQSFPSFPASAPLHPKLGWGFRFTKNCRCYDKFFERLSSQLQLRSCGI